MVLVLQSIPRIVIAAVNEEGRIALESMPSTSCSRSMEKTQVVNYSRILGTVCLYMYIAFLVDMIYHRSLYTAMKIEARDV